jgi:hypothetical protein
MLEQGYWIMPNAVLYSTELTDKQKLLFCLVSSLCAEKGYCRATNEYLWELLWADKRTISRNLASLLDKWFISIGEDEQWKRIISLDKNVKGGRQKCLGGVDKNVHPYIYMNNTIEYIYSNYYWKWKWIDENKCWKIIQSKLEQGITLDDIRKGMVLYNSECRIKQDYTYVKKLETWLTWFHPLTDDEIDEQLYTVLLAYKNKKKSDEKFWKSKPSLTLWNDLKETFGEEKVKSIRKQLNTINLTFN